MYDSAIITLILLVDLAMLWLMLKSESRKQKMRSARKFNKILQGLGMR